MSILPLCCLNNREKINIFYPIQSVTFLGHLEVPQKFNKTFPVVKDRGYTMMVSVVINGEMVSHDKKFVKIDK